MKSRSVAESYLRCGRCTRLHCHWCGRDVLFGGHAKAQDGRTATREHIVPRAAGGSDTSDNLELACKRCNNERDVDTSWVPYHEHMSDPAMMSVTQRMVLARPKLGPVGLFIESADTWAGVDLMGEPEPVKKVKSSNKQKLCTPCGAPVQAWYPGRRCYACYTHGADCAPRENSHG